MTKIQWHCKTFSELTKHELYSLLRARSEVFVVEQNCAYQDIDNKDLDALHLCAWTDDAGQKTLLAYARLLAPGTSYTEASIGRVMTSAAGRPLKLGRELMTKAMAAVAQHYPNQAIKIGAQNYLRKFYQSLGFQVVSDIYDEDGIDHVLMRFAPQQKI